MYLYKLIRNYQFHIVIIKGMFLYKYDYSFLYAYITLRR